VLVLEELRNRRRDNSDILSRMRPKGNTVELAGCYWAIAFSLSLPPCGGGLGWGGGRYETCLAGVSEARSPPTLALPHKGGGDRKAFCTSVFLLIQRYWA
jgi:hypothetical protein